MKAIRLAIAALFQLYLLIFYPGETFLGLPTPVSREAGQIAFGALLVVFAALRASGARRGDQRRLKVLWYVLGAVFFAVTVGRVFMLIF